MDLRGKTTPGGWFIEESVTFSVDHTGGHFSDCYYVTKAGKKAFLKALDIEKFDIGQVLGLLASFDYESDLVALCRMKGLSRVVQVLESDRIERDPNASPVLRFVPFLVFELADGDVRRTIDVSASVSNQWRFYVLHQTTLALLQLHGQSIAHQDLKPSNVLIFDLDKLKLGDLGRSSLRGRPSPTDLMPVPGAKNYAPFEQLYNGHSNDWTERRLSADVFHLGCLVVFAFTNICFPEYAMSKLADPYRPTNWGATYKEIMPQIQAAVVEAVQEISNDFPEKFRPQLVDIVLDLCNPDPMLRGHAGANGKSSVGLLWLQRYVSRFDILEKSSRVRGS